MNAPNNTPPASGEPDPTPHLNLLRSRLIVEELVRCGVTRFFVAPGSRSTPLVAAIAQNDRASSIVHYDERGTAFAALGHARATGGPAAWVTTSGTAVANGFPAVVEASVDEVPMILLTADRPPELRRTAANQTIDQPDIFGDYVRWSFDLPASDPGTSEQFVLTTVDQAAHRTRSVPSGPVHLNVSFREPLITSPQDEQLPLPDTLSRWTETDRPYTRYPKPAVALSADEMDEILAGIRNAKRGIVVAGRLKTREQGLAARSLAGNLGWPLLPDIASQIRLGGPTKTRIHNHDLLLADDDFGRENAPDAVIYIGAPAVSKRLGQFLAASRPATYIVVRESPVRTDPAHLATHMVESDIARFCEAVTSGLDGYTAETGWLSGWTERSAEVEDHIEEVLSGELSEPALARAVSRLVPEDNALVLASSMPVRDVDIYAVADGEPAPVVVNRGASGIDGTIATAAGYAIGSGKSVTVVIGDLALLHDLNSLAMLRELPVTVVVVNNDGGGIFSMLPISDHEKFFERYFGTPHGLVFEQAARMFGLGYESPTTLYQFEESYRRATSSGAAEIIEVTTDRQRNTELRREIVAGIPDLRR